MLIVTEEYVEDVLVPMGLAVTVPSIELAEDIVAARAGVILDEDFDVNLLTRTDRHWLRRAVVYQATWLPGQPDIMTRLDATDASTDGDAVHVNQDAFLLAPLAKWALSKTSMFASTFTEAVSQQLVPVRADTDALEVGFKRWTT
jgi:hypothetical protein